jgi:hypothetical protein
MLGGDLEEAWRLGHKSRPLLVLLHRPKANHAKRVWRLRLSSMPGRSAGARPINLTWVSSTPGRPRSWVRSKAESVLWNPGRALCMRLTWWPGKVNYAGWFLRADVGAAGMLSPQAPATSNQQHGKTCDRVLHWVRPTATVSGCSQRGQHPSP